MQHIHEFKLVWLYWYFFNKSVNESINMWHCCILWCWSVLLCPVWSIVWLFMVLHKNRVDLCKMFLYNYREVLMLPFGLVIVLRDTPRTCGSRQYVVCMPKNQLLLPNLQEFNYFRSGPTYFPSTPIPTKSHWTINTSGMENSQWSVYLPWSWKLVMEADFGFK